MSLAPPTQPRSNISPARVLVPMGLSLMLSLAGDQTLYASLAAHADVIGISVASVGVMLGVNRLVRIPSNPLGGMLADRVGRRRPFIAGMLLGALSTAIYAIAHGFWPFFIGRVAWGLAWTLLNMSALSMLLDLTVTANRGRIAGFFQVAYLLGLSSMALAGGFLVDALGFRRALLLAAGLTAVGMVIAVGALPETAPQRASAPLYTFFLALRPAALWRRLGNGAASSLWAGMDRRVLVAAALNRAVNFAGNGVVMSTVGLLLRLRFGERVAVAGWQAGVSSLAGVLLSAGPFMGLLIGPLAGRVSDLRRGRWGVIAAGFVLGILGFSLLAWDEQLGLIVAGILTVYLADGMLLPTLIAQAGDLSGAGRQGQDIGLYATGGDIGSAAGPFAAYALAQAIGLRGAYALCGGIFLLGLCAALWAGRLARKES